MKTYPKKTIEDAPAGLSDELREAWLRGANAAVAAMNARPSRLPIDAPAYFTRHQAVEWALDA